MKFAFRFLSLALLCFIFISLVFSIDSDTYWALQKQQKVQELKKMNNQSQLKGLSAPIFHEIKLCKRRFWPHNLLGYDICIHQLMLRDLEENAGSINYLKQSLSGGIN